MLFMYHHFVCSTNRVIHCLLQSRQMAWATQARGDQLWKKAHAVGAAATHLARAVHRDLKGRWVQLSYETKSKLLTEQTTCR